MAKTGLEYYRCDTNRYMDMRIKRLKKEHGCEGIAVYDYLLAEIYRTKGYYIEWNESTIFDVSDYFSIDEILVKNIISYSAKIGLFHPIKITEARVLTSASIQKRYIEMCKAAKRKDCEIKSKYNLTEETQEIQEEMAKVQEEMAKVQEETQEIQEDFSIVKESKVKERKVKNSKSHCENKFSLEEKKVEPFWEELIKVYFDFYKNKFTEKPNFTGVAAKNFKSLLRMLKNLSDEKKFIWDSVQAKKSLEFFLNGAFEDDWIRDNFEMENLTKKFNSIIQKIKNGTTRNSKSNTTGANVSTASALSKLAAMSN